MTCEHEMGRNAVAAAFRRFLHQKPFPPSLSDRLSAFCLARVTFHAFDVSFPSHFPVSSFKRAPLCLPFSTPPTLWSPACKSINPTRSLVFFFPFFLFLSVRVLRTLWGLRKALSPHRTRPSPLLPLRRLRTACRWTLEAVVFTPQGARGKWRRQQGSLTPPRLPALSTHK